MAWGAAAGAAAGGLIQSIAGIGEGVFADIQAKKAYRRQKTILKNRISWAVKDMLKAGINPMTAFIGGGGVPTGGATVGQAPTPHLSGIASAVERGAAAVQEFRQRNADRKLTETLTSKAATEREESFARQAQIQQAMHTQRQFEWPNRALEVESRRIQNEQNRITNQLMEAQLPSAKALEEFYREHPQAKQVGVILDLVNRGLHGAQQVQGLSR